MHRADSSDDEDDSGNIYNLDGTFYRRGGDPSKWADKFDDEGNPLPRSVEGSKSKKKALGVDPGGGTVWGAYSEEELEGREVGLGEQL